MDWWSTDEREPLLVRAGVAEAEELLFQEGVGVVQQTGRATEACRNGASEEQLKSLGRWSSRAYRGYIRLGDEAQEKAARRLARNDH